MEEVEHCLSIVFIFTLFAAYSLIMTLREQSREKCEIASCFIYSIILQCEQIRTCYMKCVIINHMRRISREQSIAGILPLYVTSLLCIYVNVIWLYTSNLYKFFNSPFFGFWFMYTSYVICNYIRLSSLYTFCLLSNIR